MHKKRVANSKRIPAIYFNFQRDVEKSIVRSILTNGLTACETSRVLRSKNSCIAEEVEAKALSVRSATRHPKIHEAVSQIFACRYDMQNLFQLVTTLIIDTIICVPSC